MRIASRLLFFLCLLVGLGWSCTKAVTLGSDFLEDEKSALNFSDDFSLTFNTQKTDSILTHSDIGSYQLITYLLGHLQDPIFGSSVAELYVQPVLPAVGLDLKGSTLDSVVLQLRYDTLGSYGDLNTPVTIEVYRMSESPDFTQEYYSNQTFTYFPDLLGSLTFTPRPKDSLAVVSPGDTTAITYAPHIRIPLDIQKFSELLAQSDTVFLRQDSFLNYFHGLYIRMTGANNTMLGLNLLNSLSGLAFFYDTPDEENHFFKFIFTSGSVKFVHMDQDYTGTPVEAALGPDPEADYWYIQGMSGVTTTMRVEGLDLLQNAVINEAELEVFATFPDGDDKDLFPACRYIVTQEQTDTTLNYSLDVRIALGISQGNHFSDSYDLLFGGKIGEPDPGPPYVHRYNMKVTKQIKDILKGNKENIIYFNPYSKGEVPNRAVIFGPNHPIYAPRLRIYYTSL